MVQIFGKVMNNRKQVHVALKKISGLNDHQLKSICNELNIGLDCKISDLSQLYIIRLLKVLEKKSIRRNFAKKVQSNIKRLVEVKSHRGLKFIRKKIKF